MNKKSIVVGLVLLILCSLIYLGINNSNKIKEDVILKNTIIKTVEKSDQIDFSKITNFEWDKMYIFTPYSNPKDILSKDGINTHNSKFNIEFLDSINMIGFVESNKLVKFIELPRNYGGSDLSTYVKFNKNETKFNISQDTKTIIFK